MKKCCLFLSCLLWASTVMSQSDLGLELSVDKTLADIGETVTFTIVVSNDGPNMATGIQVLDQLPAGFELERSNTNIGNYSNASGVWTIPRLGVGVNAVLTIFAKVTINPDHLNMAEITASDQMDPDSVANNGIDSDGDGNVVDDSGDEDDGDAQVVIVGGGESASKDPNPASGECLAPVGTESGMDPNPVDDINGVFKFDYKIRAIVNFGGADVDEEYARGNPNQLVMEYYVNSADGSMMLPGGTMGFFKTNFAYSNRYGTIDAAIWLANGQMVSYVYDSENDQKRSITRQSAVSANERFGTDYMNMMQFFNSSAELATLPSPLPSYVQWPRSTKGYRGELIESFTGMTNQWDIYFDTAPTPIKTSCIMMGFLVGVMKDARYTQCNRLAVYTKINIGKDNPNDYIEAILKSIDPMGITFDARPYEPLKMDGDMGTTIRADLDSYEDRMRSIEVRRMTIQRRRDRCMNDNCVKNADAEMEALRQEKERVICEGLVDMGVERSVAECLRANE